MPETGIIETVVSVINTVGFPIFVAVFMLWKNNKQMEAFTAQMSTFTDAITDMKNSVRELISKEGCKDE